MRALEPHDTKHEVFLVLGPWNHGGWSGRRGIWAELDFGAATGDEYRKTIEAPFFEKYLKDRAGFDLQDTASFRTGVNQWEQYAVWPPAKGVEGGEFVSEGGWRVEWNGAGGRWEGVVCGGSCEPDSLPESADPVDVWAGIEVVHVAGGGSAVCERAQGPGELYDCRCWTTM